MTENPTEESPEQTDDAKMQQRRTIQSSASGFNLKKKVSSSKFFVLPIL